MDEHEHPGPLERAWRACDFLVVEVPGLRQPWVVVRAGWPPCAVLPAGLPGDAREAQFAQLLLDLELRLVGWDALVARLRALRPTL